LCLCLTIVIVYLLGNHAVLYTSRFITVLETDLLLNNIILCHKYPGCNTVFIIVCLKWIIWTHIWNIVVLCIFSCLISETTELVLIKFAVLVCTKSSRNLILVFVINEKLVSENIIHCRYTYNLQVTLVRSCPQVSSRRPPEEYVSNNRHTQLGVRGMTAVVV
jgi:hypothetical protein